VPGAGGGTLGLLWGIGMGASLHGLKVAGVVAVAPHQQSKIDNHQSAIKGFFESQEIHMPEYT
jgi:hypothetical protein